MLNVVRLGLLLVALAAVQGATMEYLSPDDMIDQSTAIVRARVLDSSARLHGPLVYTHFAVSVLERLKGRGPSQLDVVVPGGEASGVRQTFAGAPMLTAGSDYLLFLWTGTSGLTHVLGYSQGVFHIRVDGAGEVSAERPASGEIMLEPGTGRRVADQPVQIRLSELRSRISSRTADNGGAQ
jgi:hypothetical protein